MSSREEFAGVAPSGRVVMSGATTGLEVLERALAGWPVLELTKGGDPPPRMHPKLCKVYGPPPPGDAGYYRGQCSSLEESETHSSSSNEWVHEEWFDSDEDLAFYTGYDDCSPSSVQRPDGSTVLGHQGRTPGHRGHPGTERRGEESRIPPTITTTMTLPATTGSTNPGSRMPRERKLPLEQTSLTSYFDNDDDEHYGDLPDAWSDDEDYAYARQSWSTPPPSYDTVSKQESLWQPYNMQQYNHEVETIDQPRNLGTFGMKPPCRFATHEDDPFATEYIKLEPSVLTIAPRAMAGQRGSHVFLSERHAAVVTTRNAAITQLSKTININRWGQTAPFPYDRMQSAPDTSFDRHWNARGKPSYQWYTKIEVACQNFRKSLVDWRRYNENLDWGFRNDLSEHDLPNQIARLNRMHREISGIEDVMYVADGIDLIFRYRRLWTVDKMKQVAPVAVSILGVIRDLQKVCQTNDWLFEDRALFLGYKVDLLLRRHQLRGLRVTTRLGYKRYGCAAHGTQDLVVQLQEYYQLGESTGPYAYNAVAPGAPIDLVQLATITRLDLDIGYHDFDKEIRRVARLHSTSEEYVNLFPFVDAADLVRRMGTSKYLMSPFKGGYEDGQHWCPAVKFRRDVYADEREEIESSDSPASDPFHPDPVNYRSLPADSNVYRHHFDIPFFKYLTPIHDDFKAAHRRKVSCRDQVLEAVIVHTASSLVTAEAVRFALQSALADGQYVHQHLGRLQEESSRTDMLEVIDRYALGPGVNDFSAIIVVRRVSIADTPWWRVDTRTGQFDHSMAAGTGSK